MKQLIILIALIFAVIEMRPQGTDMDYDRINIGGVQHFVSGLALSPDFETLAISGIQRFPFYLFDWENQEVIKKFNVGNWYAGSAIEYSSNGNYILLGRLKYADFAPNKDREVDFEIINANTGEFVKRFNAHHSVKISGDEKYAITLNGDVVSFINLETVKKEKSFTVPDATNSVAISPDGKLIAVSHKLYEDDAKHIGQLQRDKKSMKSALKYKQQISIFDAGTFKKLYTVSELYDITYKLRFSKDGKNLFCMSIPHLKIQNTSNSRQMYINVIDMTTGEPKRRGFTSVAHYEPDFKLSHDVKLFGVVSRSNRFLELHIYDFKTGKMLYRFQQSFRLFEKNDDQVMGMDSRISFVFLPGNESVMMTQGNHIIKWNFKPKE